MKCNQRLFFLPKTKESAIILIIMEKSTEICTGKLRKDEYTFHTMGRQKDYSWSNVEKADWSAQKIVLPSFVCVLFVLCV